MVNKTNGNISANIAFGGGSIKLEVSKKDVDKIKEYVKTHRYTNKTVLKLDCGFKNKAGNMSPVNLVLQARNLHAEATAGTGDEGDVI